MKAYTDAQVKLIEDALAHISQTECNHPQGICTCEYREALATLRSGQDGEEAVGYVYTELHSRTPDMTEVYETWHGYITAKNLPNGTPLYAAPQSAQIPDDLTDTQRAEFCYLVELFIGDGTGNSTGFYHTGYTHLDGSSKTTKNPHEAKRYDTGKEANKVAMKLGRTLTGTWRAVEHGFHGSIAAPQPPQADVARDAALFNTLIDGYYTGLARMLGIPFGNYTESDLIKEQIRDRLAAQRGTP